VMLHRTPTVVVWAMSVYAMTDTQEITAKHHQALAIKMNVAHTELVTPVLDLVYAKTDTQE